MPHTLPGPFLELSTANLHLNDLSVDQLAALWNVFTKVGDSLHKGRRLENFVWRAWHREAHLLPPGASWSDFADCTPLETPVLSRAGSVSQGLQRRPIVAQLTPAFWAAAEDDEAPSDPESGGGWSDDSEEERTKAKRSDVTSRLSITATPSVPRQGDVQSRSSVVSADRGRRDLVPQRTILPAADLPVVRSPQMATTSASLRRPMGDAFPLGGIDVANDRKRTASSSSSAFGSRARVRYTNLRKPNRPQPLSFRAALESLATGTESEDLTRLAQKHQRPGLGAAHERRSFQGPGFIDMLKSGGPEAEGDGDDLIAASHSSAPAGSGFEARHTGIQDEAQTPAIKLNCTATADRRKGEHVIESSQASREMPPPSLPVQHKPAAIAYKERTPSGKVNAQAQPVPAACQESGPQKVKTGAVRGQEGKKAKFFLSTSVSKSLDEESEELHEENPAPSKVPSGSTAPSKPAEMTSTQTAERVDLLPAKPSQSKTDVRSAGLAGANRNRSGASLHKGKGKAGGGKVGSSGRLGTAGLMMTKTTTSVIAPPATLAPSATTKPPKKPALVSKQQPVKKNKPVKFTMGGDDDDDGFTDEEGEPELTAKPATAAKNAEASPTSTRGGTATAAASQRESVPAQSQASKKEAEVTEVAQEDEWENDDDDQWSSDTSAEAEEERRRVEETTRRRRQAEEEHQKSLFQKIPIRSASTADLPNVVPDRPKTPLEANHPQPQPFPARGLLSSLFHPEQEPHPPPGQLHGRPHASAADLRENKGAEISRPASTTGHKPERRQHRPPSLIGSLPRASEAGGPLRASKSAVALPVLNTMTTLDGAGGGLDSDAEDDYQVASSRGGNGGSTRRSRSRQQSLAESVTESPDSAKTLNPQRQDFKRGSTSASRSRERPASAGDGLPPTAEPTHPEPLAATAVSSHRRELNPLPTPAAPQTPRTTRRNMLRDELSESLRQNLLWERQSRNRMLGIGGNPSTSTRATSVGGSGGGAGKEDQTSSARPPRRETVLGGGQLRPLTQGTNLTAGDRSSAARTGAGGLAEPRPSASHHTSSLHHHHHQHSRSTPHLPHAGSATHHQTAAGGVDNGNANAKGGLLQSPTLQHSQSGPASRPASAQTTDDEGGSSTSDARGTAEEDEGGAAGNRRKAMWSGGFPNYHQHGW